MPTPIPCPDTNCASHACRMARLMSDRPDENHPATYQDHHEVVREFRRLNYIAQYALSDRFRALYGTGFSSNNYHGSAVALIMERVHASAARRQEAGMTHGRCSPRPIVTHSETRHLVAWLERRTGVERCAFCGQSSDDCGCWHCDNCGEPHTPDTSRCEHCDSCIDSCQCVTCEHCGSLADDDGSYDCACGSTVSSVHPGLVFHGEEGHPVYPRHVGIEFEFGYKRSRDLDLFTETMERWSAGVHSDGSIRFDDSKEVATAPARGQALIQQTTEVCKAIASIGGEVNQSCGTHVHVSVKDLTGEQILGLVRLYSMTEVGLYSVVAPSRWEQSYCKPWTTDFEWAGVLDHSLNTKERSERLDVALYGSMEEAALAKREREKHECRYHGLNLNSILLYGTVEFRLHHGTINAPKILAWAGVCSALVQYAATHTEREIRNLRGSAFEILCKVAHHRPLVKWLKERKKYFDQQRGTKLDGLNLAAPPTPATYEDSESL